MLFEHLQKSKKNFKQLLLEKKFDSVEIPIVNDYFSTIKNECGYLISFNATLNKIVSFLFLGIKKSQSATLTEYIEHLLSIFNESTTAVGRGEKFTVSFAFKDNKVSVFILNVLHIVVDDKNNVKFSISGLDFSLDRTMKIEKLIVLLNDKITHYFKQTHNIEYTKENIDLIQTIINTLYNLKAPHYREFLNKDYSQTNIAQYMNEHYDGIMLSSVMNRDKPLRTLLSKPTVDMSRKINNNGKFYGNERVTFPVKNLKHSEKLFDLLLVNDWSKNLLQLINAMILYQYTINGIIVNHFSLFLPTLGDEKKFLTHFDLFSVSSDSEIYFDNKQSFKIDFKLDIYVQVKDGRDVVYEHNFETLDKAYIHFIDYFKKRVIKQSPDGKISNMTMQLLSILNFDK